MPDYGNEIRFGWFLIPDAHMPEAALDTAAVLDRAGFDFVGVQDHPYQREFLDTWTLLSAIAARTDQLSVFPDVASLPLRPPAVLAKAAASLDLLSGGRVELGLGTGAFWDGIAAMGGPRRSPGESVRALREAVSVIRLMWSGERSIRFDGDFYSVDGLHPGPVPAHPMGVWIGGYKPRMLRLIGEIGDGWLPTLSYIDDAGIATASATIDEAATAAGRDPASIRRVLNVGGDVPLEDLPRRLISFALDHGIDTFILGGHPTEESLTYLAQEIFPRVRDGVAAGR
ncbi:alkanesulfonate monooxygenase SsuD/methylene tetrahydromethanopterin reductase-like flavin-dependent oxidoreductase (luciferase family) [Rhodococcus sp. LBL1]|nr:alkanesulfonate monooxygenase SsuD/methylene tetrahydromethanopterin reductase-like flavin-dependent oxidoreductase (luciferase family) [Rhodococcus sp. LBL1]MDH6682858.1 alkanesulfonate monooxygenase SsuD/methylene tetrahydromethanopterin reductase-like flavin-dependent oxidoreductase (luciferase family) [Rhodococcus sp. LBL2]